MKLSRKFLSDYLDVEDISLNDLAEDMTSIGNEYDSASPLINCTNLTIGKVISCVDHPDSDHLHVCKVDIGTEVLDIVCGAPNVCEGIKVIVALNGAVLPGGTIKKGMIRGQESNGMICSIAELGLDNKFLTEEDKNGICVLGEDAVLGEDPIKYLGYDDEVIDFELYSNRGDLLSILGMAYEIGAIYDRKVKDIELKHKNNDEDINDSFSLDIQTENCPMFLAKKAINVTIKESPSFIKERLISSGIRPINNVVDISNYVMLETGQPLHYYDADCLGDKIIVRMAKDNEELTTLDGISRNLTTEDIVIANGESKAIGLAGVMGGLSTEIEEDTKNILIESAIFNFAKIRRTSKKILRSEASSRFEKGLDPNRTYMAIERTCHLLEKYADATIVGGLVVYDTMDKKEKEITIEFSKIYRVLGTVIDKDEVVSIFKRLGFKVDYNEESATVIVPTRRLDISIEEDLIEEVGRIYGINKIEGKLPVSTLKPGSYDKVTRDLRNKMVSLGLNEVLTYTLVNKDEVLEYTTDKFIPIKIANPMTEDRSYLRYSLIPSLVRTYLYNTSRNNKNISLFEIGKSFFELDNEYHEEKHLAVLMEGSYFDQVGNDIKIDFYVIKGILEEVLDYLGYNNRYQLEVTENIPSKMHPGVSAVIKLQGKEIGIIGKIHPNVMKDNVYVMEINLDKLFSNKVSKMTFKELPKYPSVEKDVAFILDKNIASNEVEKVIKKAGGKLLYNISIFDIYRGDNIDKDKVSIAFSLTFRDNNKTLTDEEVTVVFNNIILEVTKKCNAILRDN